MSRVSDISAWALNPLSGCIRSGDLGAGSVHSGNIGSGQVGGLHFASGALAAAINNLGSAVANRSLTGEAANNSGLLLTVSGTGMYRVSTYAEVTQGGLLNAGSLSVRFDWTDEGQAQNFSPVTGLALITSGAFSQGITVVRAVSGSSIIMTVSLSSLVGSPVYNAYGAVERVF